MGSEMCIRDRGKLLMQLRHPHVVGCYGVYRTQGAVYSALEVAPYELGDAVRAAKGRGGEGVRVVVGLAAQLLAGLAHMHAAGWVHCDVKAENVLVGVDGRVKVGDLGAAMRKEEGRLVAGAPEHEMRGTMVAWAPEMWVEGLQYTEGTDVWAAGLAVESAWTGQLPYTHKVGAVRTMTECYRAVMGAVGAQAYDVAREVPAEVAAVVRACSVVAAGGRPRAGEVAKWAEEWVRGAGGAGPGLGVDELKKARRARPVAR